MWLTNDKALYVAKEDSICLVSVIKKAALNKQDKNLASLLELFDNVFQKK